MRQTGKITLVTPTYAKDLERFRFQRESIERLGICDRIRHLAVVDHEDLPLFKDIGFDRNLDILSTRQVLPRKIEQRRAARGYRRRDPRYWLTPKPLHGWMVQQIIKLAAVEAVDTEGIVSLDCDTFFVRPIDHGDYFAEDGRMLLFEEDVKAPAKFMDWVISAMKFLKVRLNQAPVNVYTFSAVPMHCGVIADLKRHIEKVHGCAWDRAIIAGNVFEYSLHGVYARFVDQCARQVAVEPTLTLHLWNREDMAGFADHFAQRVANSSAKAAMIQGNMGLSPQVYGPTVRQAWQHSSSMASIPA